MTPYIARNREDAADRPQGIYETNCAVRGEVRLRRQDLFPDNSAVREHTFLCMHWSLLAALSPHEEIGVGVVVRIRLVNKVSWAAPYTKR